MANPIRARIYYKVDEKICESGEYLIKDKKVTEYFIQYYDNLWASSKKIPENILI